MRSGFAIALGIILSALALATAVQAQEKRTPEQLTALSEQAMAAAQGGDFAEAISIWEDILPEVVGEGRVGLHYNLALAYKRLKQLPEAWYHLTTYLETVGEKDVKAGKSLEKLEKQLMKTHRKVAITCDQQGAGLYFGLEADGIRYQCPVTWWFVPGKQFAYVVKDGYVAQSAQYDVRERGEKGVWAVQLVPLPKYGHLVVKGEGKAIQVFLNGSLEGKVPFKRKLKEGTYELMVGKPGKMPWKKTVVVKADQTTVEEPPNAQPKVAGDQLPVTSDQLPVTSDQLPVEKRSKAGPVALLAGGLGVVVVGAILNGVGHSKEGDFYDEHYPDENTPRDEAQAAYDAAFEDEIKGYRGSSIALYAIGGSAAAAGAIWLIVDAAKKPKDKAKGIKVAPMMGPGTAGAVFGLEF